MFLYTNTVSWLTVCQWVTEHRHNNMYVLSTDPKSQDMDSLPTMSVPKKSPTNVLSRLMYQNFNLKVDYTFKNSIQRLTMNSHQWT